MFYQLKIAEEKDLAKLTGFVEKAGLSSDGFESLIDYFVMMENGEHEVVACIGVEPMNEYGLLRSLVVSDKLKQAHILTLFQSIQTLAEQKGIKQLYLVTNKEASVQFLSLLGFEEIEKASIPSQLLSLDHLKGSIEEGNAKIMVKSP
jgi:N-acetylglutamate synthase-like GNAT family acetyltransferase